MDIIYDGKIGETGRSDLKIIFKEVFKVVFKYLDPIKTRMSRDVSIL